jgi:SNF2 family DNA or RNA helicase
MLISERHKVVALPARPDLVNLFPHAKLAPYDGQQHIILPHGFDETRMLRNLGVECPAPILHQYDWASGTPFDVQKKTCAMLTMEPRAYVLNGMGTGKTKAALWSWDFLYSQGKAKRLLVVAPLSTLNFVWAKEVFNTIPHRSVAVLHGTRAKRLKRLAEGAEILVINHDGIGTIMDDLLAADIDTLVLDELATYRNGQSQRTKAMRKFAKAMRWVWGMTGSPTPNEPTDVWGQATIVTPANVPQYFNRFRDDLMHKVTQFKFVPKPDAIDKAYAAMQPSVRFTLDDVVELPDLIERQIDVEMGEKQGKVYSEMEKHCHAAIAAQEITAVNAGATLQKLLQISTGWVYTRDRTVVPLDNDKRLEALDDILASTDRKAIVFVPFLHAIDGIVERLTKAKVDFAVVHGDVPQNARGAIFNAFQQTSKYKVLVAHPQCMAHGVTLTAADTICWFAPTTSLEIFEQANARIRRIGQKHKQQILMLQSTKVERKIYARLRAKQKTQNALLDLFAENS